MPNRTPTPRKTTTQRGYGQQHQKTRARLLTRHIDGKRCRECGQPMYKDPTRNWDNEPLHAHHPNGNPTRTTASELLHSLCNKRIGDPTRTRQPHNLEAITDPYGHPDTELGHLAMNWPTP